MLCCPQIGEKDSATDKGRRVIATGTGFISGLAVTNKKGGSDKLVPVT